MFCFCRLRCVGPQKTTLSSSIAGSFSACHCDAAASMGADSDDTCFHRYAAPRRIRLLRCPALPIVRAQRFLEANTCATEGWSARSHIECCNAAAPQGALVLRPCRSLLLGWVSGCGSLVRRGSTGRGSCRSRVWGLGLLCLLPSTGARQVWRACFSTPADNERRRLTALRVPEVRPEWGVGPIGVYPS